LNHRGAEEAVWAFARIRRHQDITLLGYDKDLGVVVAKTVMLGAGVHIDHRHALVGEDLRPSVLQPLFPPVGFAPVNVRARERGEPLLPIY
jgi:hypothetical protein